MICRVSAERIAATGERDRGPTDIYCRYSDQGKECYGGVESCVLHPESFDIRFWPRAQEEIGLETLTINFPPQSPALPDLGAALSSIFRGIGIFSWRTEKTEMRRTGGLRRALFLVRPQTGPQPRNGKSGPAVLCVATR